MVSAIGPLTHDEMRNAPCCVTEYKETEDRSSSLKVSSGYGSKK